MLEIRVSRPVQHQEVEEDSEKCFELTVDEERDAINPDRRDGDSVDDSTIEEKA